MSGFIASRIKGRKDKGQRPLFGIIYGPGGIGKTRFCSQAPSPYYIDFEEGSHHYLPDKNIEEEIGSYEILEKVIQSLIEEEHSFKTLVIDTLEGVQDLIHLVVATEKGKTSIHDIGYNKGPGFALEKWKGFIPLLRELRRKRNMHILLVGHSKEKKRKAPELSEAYDKYHLDLTDLVADYIFNEVEFCLFCNTEEHTSKTENGMVRAFSDGKPKMYAGGSTAFRAKNRLGLPAQFAAEWSEFEKLLKTSNPNDPERIRDILRGLIGAVDNDKDRTTYINQIKEAGDDFEKLNRIEEKLQTYVS